MARIGGRNSAATWIVGVLSLAVIGALVWVAQPILPMLADYATTMFGNATQP